MSCYVCGGHEDDDVNITKDQYPCACIKCEWCDEQVATKGDGIVDAAPACAKCFEEHAKWADPHYHYGVRHEKPSTT